MALEGFVVPGDPAPATTVGRPDLASFLESQGGQAPYTGQAPEPQRTAPFQPGMETHDLGVDSNMPVPSNTPLPAIHPSALGQPLPQPLPQPGQLMASAPPAQPDYAAEAARWRKEYGDLKAEVGQMRQAFETRIEELLLQQRIAAAGTGNGVAAPAQAPADSFYLPPGADPNTMPTLGTVSHMLNQGIAHTLAQSAAQAIRASWDVTPAEEQTAMLRFPGLAHTPEPERTRLLRDTVLNQRRAQAAVQAPTAPPTPEPAAAVTPTRPLGYVAPMAPQAAGPVVPEPPQASTLLEQAMAQYEAAGRIKDMRERTRQQEYWWKRVNDLQGITEDVQRNAGYRIIG